MSAVGELRIVEGISGLWHYHLTNDRDARAMCGAWTMAEVCSGTITPLDVPAGAIPGLAARRRKR